LTHYYTACMFHAHFMHYTESDHQKLGGPIHCWSPQPKSWGGTCLSPPVPMVVAPIMPHSVYLIHVIGPTCDVIMQ